MASLTKAAITNSNSSSNPSAKAAKGGGQNKKNNTKNLAAKPTTTNHPPSMGSALSIISSKSGAVGVNNQVILPTPPLPAKLNQTKEPTVKEQPSTSTQLEVRGGDGKDRICLLEDSCSNDSLATVVDSLEKDQQLGSSPLLVEATEEKNEWKGCSSRMTSRKCKNNNKKGVEKSSSSSSEARFTRMSEEMRAAAFDQRKKTFDTYVAQLKHKGLHALSGEIDRCLKKVSEGVETFEDIWQKVHNATNTNQKEKYETDLKKEIKKLQRLRDQIKSWIASGEIKDKSTLVDTRKLIETQMERFKVVERETKTKAYSKEGLGATQKLDPTTREREDLNNWLIASIDQMQIQMDQFESEIESLMAGKKKRLDKEKQDRLDELKVFLERHKFHMSKLETLMRMLDNLSVDVNALREFLSQVKKIKDDIEYYLESSQEAEFEENEFLYDDIEGLEEQQALGNLALTVGGDSELGGTPTSTSGNNSPVSPIHSSDSSSDPDKRRKSSDDSSNKVNDVVRPLALKPNHSPSPVGKGSVLAVVETPPLNVETLNNSSPSSGLSNHVSSLSSLSSSPTQTHNYQNALNNVKSLSHLEDREHNSSSPLVTNSNLSSLSESTPSSLIYNNSSKNSTSNYGSIVNNSPPSSTFLYTDIALAGHSTTTSSSGVSAAAVVTGTFNGLTASSHESSGSENSDETIHSSRLASPPPTHSTSFNEIVTPASSPPKNHVNVITNSSSFHYGEASENGLENNTPEAKFMSSPPDSSSFILPPSTNHPRLGPEDSSLSLLSSISLSMCPASSTTLVNHSGSVVTSNHLGAGLNVTSMSMSGSAKPATTMTNGPGSGQLHGAVGSLSSLSSQTISNACANNSNVNVTFPHLDQQLVQQSSNRDMTPPSVMDFMRMPTEQMLLGRYVNESGDTMTLKSMAQDAIDRAGIQITDPDSSQLVTMEADIPPLLGVAPLGPVPLQKDHHYQLQMLEAAHLHLPVSADSERMRQFLPRNPFPAPPYYPQHPLSNSDSQEFFQRLSIETLFFIFYYLEGTKAQYLAAKVLKKQSWRFHTKYMMWFQRHEEPKVINEDYEQGTYIYFDIEKWGQRKKDGFVFEYRYLEDRELS